MKKIIKGRDIDDCLNKLSNIIKVPVSEINGYTVVQQDYSFMFGLIKKPCIIEYDFREKSSEQSKSEKFRIDQAIKIADELDGFFNIEYLDGGAYLTVYPPGTAGKRVDENDIIKRLNFLKVINIKKEKISELIYSDKTVSDRVGDWPDGESYNSYFTMSFEKNNMEVYVIVYPPKPEGKYLDKEKILKGLSEKKVVKGVLEENIDELLDKKIFAEKILVAKGQLPVKGKDAFFKYYFDREKKVNLKEKPDGSVDFRELNNIHTVKKGDLICEKIEPTEGVNGFDVFGNILYAESGKDIIIKNGKNTYIDVETQKVYAGMDGEPVINHLGEIDISRIFKVEGDVNYSTGNIDFDGTVIIEGRVEDNFKVKATGDIIINGNIGKSNVVSQTNIFIDGGISGKEEAYVSAGINLCAKFIENATVKAGVNIIVQKMIMHSNITAGSQVRVTGTRGALIGGHTRAGEAVIANELGAIGAAITTVEVGVPPEIIEQLSSLEIERKKESDKLEKIKLAINTIESDADSERKDQLNKFYTLAKVIDEKLNALKFEIKQLKRVMTVNKKAKIQVRDKLFANSHILFGNIQRNFTKEEIHVRLGLIDNKITILPYD